MNHRREYYFGMLCDRYDALLVANGFPPQPALLRALRPRVERIIALDGGLNALLKMRIIPSHVIGDLDSAAPSALAWVQMHGGRIIRRPVQDQPDIAKGIAYCRDRGWTRLLICGAAGERLDHTLAALACAFTPRMRIHFVTGDSVILPLHGRAAGTLTVPPGHSVSWIGFPAAGPCALQGVRWPFTRRILNTTGYQSLSNAPLSLVRYRQARGQSLLFISLDRQ